jgi:NADPH:quinone reductase-like Zn-dependent oxidoreductase
MVLLPNSLLKRTTELEFAGEIVDADASSGFAPGDKVAGFVAPNTHITKRRGALAQYIAVKPAEIVKRPDFLTTIEASGVLGVALTAYQCLFEFAGLRQEPGQSVFINGGSTSVGMYAIQIAKSYGIKVAASTSGKNAKLVEELGAEVSTTLFMRPWSIC